MRTKYSMINMIFGVGGHVLNMVLAFVSRMIFIRYLDAAYLGVSGLFSDILGMLNLAELGIGSAMIFSMYKPAALDDREQLGKLMNLYKLMYRLVAVFVLAAGLCLLPFLNVLIKGDPGIEHIRLIYLMYLGNSVSSYLLSYKNSILQAYQRAYVRTVVEQIAHAVQIILQVVVLIVTQNFLLYLLLQILTQISINLVVSRRVDKEFPYLKDEKRLPSKEERSGIMKNILALSMHRLGSAVVNSTDNLLMSAFVGLTSVGIYSNYKLVIKSLSDLLNKVYTAFTGSIGNLGATQDPAYIYRIYKQLDFFLFLLFGYFSAGMVVLFNPFIKLMFGEEYLFSQTVVIIVVVQFYITGMRQINLQFREAMGLFWYDRYKPVAESIINLVVSILLVQRYGVAGVFLGTIVSTMTTCFWVEPYILMKYGLKEQWQEKLRDYFIEYGRRALTVVGGSIVGLCFTGGMRDSFLWFILKGILFTVEYAALIFLTYGRSEEFEALLEHGKNFLKQHLDRKKT